MEEAVRLLGESDLPRKEVYVFTDLSRAAWPGDAAAALQDGLVRLPGASVCLIDVGVKEPVNFALGEVRLSQQVLSNLGSLDVRSGHRLRRRGRRADRRTAAGGRRPARQTVALRPGESREVEFRVEGLKVGVHQGTVRIVGEDALAADNVRFFTVEVKPPWRVLVAAAKPAQRSALFLTEALAPTLARKRGRARFDCRVVDVEELSRRPWEGYAAVCLLDPPPLEAAVWQAVGGIRFRRARRGGLPRAATPGRSIPSTSRRRSGVAGQAASPGAAARRRRLPGPQPLRASRSSARSRRQASAIPWDAFPVFRYWELERLAAGAGVVMPYLDGRPALIERSVGNGRTLRDDHAGLRFAPRRDRGTSCPPARPWPFVILVNQMTSYLVGGGQEQLNYFAGQTAVVAPGRAKPPADLRPQRPGRAEVLPARRSEAASARRHAPRSSRGIIACRRADECPAWTAASASTLPRSRRSWTAWKTSRLAELFGPLQAATSGPQPRPDRPQREHGPGWAGSCIRR